MNRSGAAVTTEYHDGRLNLCLSGRWSVYSRRPSIDEIDRLLKRQPAVTTITFSHDDLEWDTSLLLYLSGLESLTKRHSIDVDTGGLPGGVTRLLALANAVPPRQTGAGGGERTSFLARIGNAALSFTGQVPAKLAFLGELVLATGRLVRGRAQYRRSDILLVIEEVGPKALPIVSLISFLVGLILAYMAAVQLARFGAQIYIANLVSIGMVREMAALMTGIILAGRTGGAFAAQLGTMQVNEEIDAFRTLGISPMDFLVLPRLLALVAMAPLLTFYGGIVGTFAGLVVAVAVFDIGIVEYYYEVVDVLSLKQFGVGIFKGTVYGALVAVAGCYEGIHCGRSAQAVGRAATAAVVSGILYIVIGASLITIVFQELGI